MHEKRMILHLKMKKMTCVVVTVLRNHPEAFASDLGDDQSHYLFISTVLSQSKVCSAANKIKITSIKTFIPGICSALQYHGGAKKWCADSSVSDGNRWKEWWSCSSEEHDRWLACSQLDVGQSADSVWKWATVFPNWKYSLQRCDVIQFC